MTNPTTTAGWILMALGIAFVWGVVSIIIGLKTSEVFEEATNRNATDAGFAVFCLATAIAWLMGGYLLVTFA